MEKNLRVLSFSLSQAGHPAGQSQGRAAQILIPRLRTCARRSGSSDKIARLGRSDARFDRLKCVIAVPMIVASTT